MKHENFPAAYRIECDIQTLQMKIDALDSVVANPDSWVVSFEAVKTNYSVKFDSDQDNDFIRSLAASYRVYLEKKLNTLIADFEALE